VAGCETESVKLSHSSNIVFQSSLQQRFKFITLWCWKIGCCHTMTLVELMPVVALITVCYSLDVLDARAVWSNPEQNHYNWFWNMSHCSDNSLHVSEGSQNCWARFFQTVKLSALLCVCYCVFCVSSSYKWSEFGGIFHWNNIKINFLKITEMTDVTDRENPQAL